MTIPDPVQLREEVRLQQVHAGLPQLVLQGPFSGSGQVSAVKQRRDSLRHLGVLQRRTSGTESLLPKWEIAWLQGK